MSIVMQVIFSMDLLLVFVEKNIRKKDLEKGKKITLNCSQLRGGGCKLIIFWIVQPLFACSASSQQGGNAPCARITLKNLLKLNSSNGLLPTQTDLSHSAEEFEWSHVCLEGVFFFCCSFIDWFALFDPRLTSGSTSPLLMFLFCTRTVWTSARQILSFWWHELQIAEIDCVWVWVLRECCFM